MNDALKCTVIRGFCVWKFDVCLFSVVFFLFSVNVVQFSCFVHCVSAVRVVEISALLLYIFTV